MAEHRLHDLWAELTAELHALRTVFEPTQIGAKALKDFDEYLSANEFGLALETLCDCLIESDDQTISTDLLVQISRLHSKIGLDDNCVRQLQQKRSVPG